MHILHKPERAKDSPGLVNKNFFDAVISAVYNAPCRVFSDPLPTMRTKFRNLLQLAKCHATVLNLTAFVLLLVAMFWLFPTTVTGLHLADAPQETFYIPHTFSEIAASYDIQGTLSVDFRPTTRHLTLRADDCVEFVTVDGKPILNQTCGVCQACDPIVLALPEHITTGAHQIRIRIRNLQGFSSFDVRQAHGFGLIQAALCLAISLAWLWVVRRQAMSMWSWWIVIFAMLLAVSYFLATDLSTRQMDVQGHQQYVGYLLTYHALPRVNYGWETFQPPLYYMLSAGWVVLGSLLSSLESWRWLQLFAMTIYLATVMIATLIWNKFEFVKSRWPGLALFAFLPANVYLSARINNDALFPLWGTLVTFFLWEYVQREQVPSLWALSLCLVLAMMSKFSGVALFAAVVVFLGWHEWTNRRTLPQIIDHLSWVVLPGAIWLLIWTLVDYAQTRNIIYSNYALNARGLRMTNDLYRYFSLDLQAIMTQPFFYTWGGPIRNSWPTALLVSSLFGEFNLGYLGWGFLSILATAFLPVAALPVIGFFSKPNDARVKPWLLAMVLVTFQVLFIAVGQWFYTIAGDSDARYWAAVFFPMAVLAGWGYEVGITKTGSMVRWVCQVIPIVFFALLAAFYLKLLVP